MVLLRCSLLVLVAATAVAGPDPCERIDGAEAEALTLRATAAGKAGRYEEALDYLRAAEALDRCEAKIPYLQGRALEELGRVDAARKAYGAVIATWPESSSAAKAAERMQGLAPSPAPTQAEPVAPPEQEPTTAAVPEPPAPPEEPPAEVVGAEAPPAAVPEWVGWTLVGVGAAALVGGVVLDQLAASSYDDYERAGADGDEARYRAYRDDFEDRRLGAGVLYGLGAVSAVAGGGVLLFARPDGAVAVAFGGRM